MKMADPPPPDSGTAASLSQEDPSNVSQEGATAASGASGRPPRVLFARTLAANSHDDHESTTTGTLTGTNSQDTGPLLNEPSGDDDEEEVEAEDESVVAEKETPSTL
jgi:hypothetical protein